MEKKKNKKGRLALIKLLMPAMIKTIPQTNFNDNKNETVVILGEEEKKIIQELSQAFIEKLKEK